MLPQLGMWAAAGPEKAQDGLGEDGGSADEVACTRSGAIMFGRMCLLSMRGVRTGGDRGLHVFLLAQGQHLAADQAREARHRGK